MALEPAVKANKLKKATGASVLDRWLDAYSKASSIIYAHIGETSSGNNWGACVPIPKDMVKASLIRLISGGYDGSNNRWFINIFFSTTNAGGSIISSGTTLTSDIEYFYD
jgi:hypothetical protein